NTFKLKKDISFSKFDVFKNDNIKLIVTGVGKIRSAIATTSLLVKEPPNPEDRILNIGICGSGIIEYKTGEYFLINKIDDYSSRKSFYPETVFKHTLEEERIITFDRPVSRKEFREPPACLVDMEASGFYEAASQHFHSHKIHLLKIISDHLKGEKLTGSFVQGLMEKLIPALRSLIDDSYKVIEKDTNVLNSDDYQVFETVSSDLKLSTTQRFQVLDLIKGYKIRSGGDMDFLRKFVKQKKSSKVENKKVFDEIVDKLEDVMEED
ncbi:MAG: hypothetical protein EBS19_07805, partial [Spirochaetia bacterium]|nr:hypothetical protein [Spirochaetia bacterium]